MVQPCIWFKEEPSQSSMGQMAQSLTCSIMDEPHTGLDECPRILLSCFRAKDYEEEEDRGMESGVDKNDGVKREGTKKWKLL